MLLLLLLMMLLLLLLLLLQETLKRGKWMRVSAGERIVSSIEVRAWLYGWLVLSFTVQQIGLLLILILRPTRPNVLLHPCPLSDRFCCCGLLAEVNMQYVHFTPCTNTSALYELCIGKYTQTPLLAC
jgi:hypothetical protein